MKPTILTIGYQQATQAAVLAALREAGVEVLADVRARPLSRKPGFSKTALAAAVEEIGIEYRHFRHVGTPPEGREAAKKGDRATLRRVYAGQLELPEARNVLRSRRGGEDEGEEESERAEHAPLVLDSTVE